MTSRNDCPARLRLPGLRIRRAVLAAVLLVAGAAGVSGQPGGAGAFAGKPDAGFAGSGTVTASLSSLDDAALAAAVDPAGRVLAAGYATIPPTGTRAADLDFALARFMQDGTLDPTFAGDGTVTNTIFDVLGSSAGDGAHAYAVAVEPDGRIIAAGGADNGNGLQFALTRYRDNGSLDESFGVQGVVTTDAPGDAVAHALAIQPDGRIVAAGGTLQAGDGVENWSFVVARYRFDGTPDLSFGSSGLVVTTVGADTGILIPSEEPIAHAVALLPDGRILAAGSSFNGTDLDFALVRYTADGVPDATFGGGDGVVTTPLLAGDDEIRAVQVLADGRIIAAGWTENGADADFALARYTADGALDPTFGTGGPGPGGTVVTKVRFGDRISAMVGGHDGTITVAGSTEVVGPGGLLASYKMVVARYLSSGSLDPDFGSGGLALAAPGGGNSSANGLALRPDGGVVAVGSAGVSPTDFALAAFQSDPVMTVADTVVREGSGGSSTATFAVSLSAPAGPTGASAAFEALDGSATAPDDYAARTGTVTFAPGTSDTSVEIGVRPDRLDEAAEQFTLRLSNSRGATIRVPDAFATVVDDESPTIDTEAGGPQLIDKVIVAPDIGPGADDTVLVRLCADPRRTPCADLSAEAVGPRPNPLSRQGVSFLAGDPVPDVAMQIRSIPGGTGLDISTALQIDLPAAAPAVELTFAFGGSPPRVWAITTSGERTAEVVPAAAPGGAVQVRVPPTPALDVAQEPFAVAAAEEFVYVADPVNHVIRFIDPSAPAGSKCPCETVFAGNGARGRAWTGVDPLASEMGGAYAMAPGRTAPGVVADMYVADTFGHQVLRVTPPAPTAPPGTAPSMQVIAGSGDFGFGGDGGSATAAELNSPYGIARDEARGLTYVADTLNSRIRVIRPGGTIATIAGTGAAGYAGDGGAALTAQLNQPRALALDTAGNLYIADTDNNVVRRLDLAGTITTVAGTPGLAGALGDGGPAVAARLNAPAGVAVDPGTSSIFVADTRNHRVRRVDVASGQITTIAGTGTGGFGGDGGDARSAQLDSPFGVATRPGGQLLVADTRNARIRLLSPPGPSGVRTIATLAGNGTPSHGPDVVAAAAGQLAGVSSVAAWVDPDPFIPGAPPRLVKFLADPFDHTVKLIDGNGRLSTIAGDGMPGFRGDGGPAAAARLDSPFGLALNRTSPPTALFVTDTFNNVVRRIGVAISGGTVVVGNITTVAGDGTPGYSGDGGPATTARLSFPTAVAVDRAGDVFIADAYNARVRKVGPGNVIATVAGTGRLGFSGDGGPPGNADLNFPLGVAVDDAVPPTVYIADSFNHRVRRVDPVTGAITTVAGNGTAGNAADGQPAAGSPLNRPWGVGLGGDPEPGLLIADSLNNRVRRVDLETGRMSTVAAAGGAGRQGDLGPSVEALLSGPRGVAATDQVVFVADSFSSRMRRVGLPLTAPIPDHVVVTSSPFDIGCTTTCEALNVDVANPGKNTLAIEQVTLAGPAAGDFRIAHNGCRGDRLPGGGRCRVRLTFAPTALCPTDVPCRNAVLRVRSNGADSVREIRLSGSVERPTCLGRPATIVGTGGDDVLTGTDQPDVIHGGSGNDRIAGLGGNDVICGGAGDDGVDAIGEMLDGGPGNDLISGGLGADILAGNGGDDVVWGDEGNDYLDGGVGGCCDPVTNTGNDILLGGDGDDILWAADFGRATIVGEAGADTIHGLDGNDRITGGAGNDTAVDAGAGSDFVDIRDGVTGNDAADAGPGFDICYGDPLEPMANCADLG